MTINWLINHLPTRCERILSKFENFVFTAHAVNCNNKSSAVAEMGDRLATIGMGQKLGGVPLGELGPI